MWKITAISSELLTVVECGEVSCSNIVQRRTNVSVDAHVDPVPHPSLQSVQSYVVSKRDNVIVQIVIVKTVPDLHREIKRRWSSRPQRRRVRSHVVFSEHNLITTIDVDVVSIRTDQPVKVCRVERQTGQVHDNGLQRVQGFIWNTG